MNLTDRKEKYDRVKNILKNSDFKDATINTVLYKKIDQDELIDMSICFENERLSNIFIDNPIIVSSQISEIDKQAVIDLISSLENGFEACYLSLEMHIVIHKVFENNSEIFKNQMDGIYRYLEYCKETSINNTVLDNLTFYNYCDLFHMYYEDCFRGYEIITSTIFNNDKLLLGFNEKLGYMIAVLDKDTFVLKEMKQHRYFDSAVNDYKNRYYDNCISEYQSKDQDMNDKINKHIHFLNTGDENA
jgi:hypothetical protein